MKYITLPNGMGIACLNLVNTLGLYDEIFVHNVYGSTGVEIGDGDVVFDVGANIGLFALWCNRHYHTKVVVHCFEPSPATFAALVYNHSPQLCRRVAILDRFGKAEFTHYPHLPELSTAFPDAFADGERAAWREYVERRVSDNWFWGWLPRPIQRWAAGVVMWHLFRDQSIVVTCTTLERELMGFSHVDLLKIDVEKSEMAALMGIGSAWPKIKQIIVESWGDPALTEAIDDLLRRKGFSVTWHDNPCFPELRTPLAFGRRMPV